MGMPDDEAVIVKGLDLFRRMDQYRSPVFERQHWMSKAMAYLVEHPELKLPLFRFIDALPNLTTNRDIIRHVDEYFLGTDSPLPGHARALATALKFGGAPAARIIRASVESLARNFIVGDRAETALPSLRALSARGRGFSVDLLGEAALSETEADQYRDRYLNLIDRLAAASWPAPADRAATFPALCLSVKISALYSRIGPVNHDDSVEQIKARLRPIFAKVKAAGGLVFIDMENAQLKALTLDVFTGLRDEAEFAGWPHAGIALQAYLRSARDDVRRLIVWAERRGHSIPVRLVKGAYWEYENTVAAQRGWPLPVFASKTETDASFEACLGLLMGCPSIQLAVATHNVRSVACALVQAERLALPPQRCEFQMLYGMAEPLKRALTAMGLPVRDYAPIGELIPGMAYLVRRLLENTSNDSFLRRSAARDSNRQALLAAPTAVPRPQTEPDRHDGFCNEPPLDFSIIENRTGVATAIRQVQGHLGRHLPTDGADAEPITSRNPARPDEVICTVTPIDPAAANRAISRAAPAQKRWAELGARRRAEILLKAAAIARRRRLELIAIEILEVGKNWMEADADVCEAIDFLVYYAMQMLSLAEPRRLGSVPGEDNRYGHRPRGIGVVIAPWNFPLAISMGMVSASLVTGNAVLYKPSSLSLLTGRCVVDMLHDAGVPQDLLQFLPSHGAVLGNHLVADPRIDFIAFTGSLEVGLQILEQAGKTRPDQRGPKKVVIETGGKNAVIVDDDADLDQAVPGIIQSAFGFQGQKCSACSRAIVLDAIYDRFIDRLGDAVRDIAIGDPQDPRHFMGPVIDDAARRRILDYIRLGAREGRIMARGSTPGGGHYVPPTVIADLPPQSRLLREEIFGPVLAVQRATSIAHAIDLANSSAYGLTGGLYSRSPAAIDRVSRYLDAGNVYINRPITGALVGRQPFGGVKMSGVGSKAGGPDYLLQFMEPRVVTENTLRRGFSPEFVGGS